MKSLIILAAMCCHTPSPQENLWSSQDRFQQQYDAGAAQLYQQQQNALQWTTPQPPCYAPPPAYTFGDDD